MVATTPTIATVTQLSKLFRSSSVYRRLNPTTKSKVVTSTKLSIHSHINFSSTRVKGSFPIEARDPQRDGKEESDSFTSQEDLDYLWKLVVGSVAGGAMIKYGSVVFPEITRPNITQALFIILTPVIIAVLLLFNQSLVERE